MLACWNNSISSCWFLKLPRKLIGKDCSVILIFLLLRLHYFIDCWLYFIWNNSICRVVNNLLKRNKVRCKLWNIWGSKRFRFLLYFVNFFGKNFIKTLFFITHKLYILLSKRGNVLNDCMKNIIDFRKFFCSNPIVTTN